MKIKSKIANVANIEFMKAVVERFDSPHVMLEQDYKADWGVYYVGKENLRTLTLQKFLTLMQTMNNELEAFNKSIGLEYDGFFDQLKEYLIDRHQNTLNKAR